MKRTILSVLVMGMAAGPALAGREIDPILDAPAVGATVPVPPEVQQSAVAAVNDLGKQVVTGNHKAALDRMFPVWKEKLAAQVPGGMKALEKTMENLGKEMAKNGTSFLSFKAVGAPSAYEVESGKEPVLGADGKPAVDKKTGKPVEQMIFKKWLLVVPTLTEIRLTEPPSKQGELPKMRVVVSHSYQIAITDKGKNDWTFIDGSTLRISELRRLFFNLPENMALPEIKKEEKKANQ